MFRLKLLTVIALAFVALPGIACTGITLKSQDGSTVISNGSIYDIADMCPWVRYAV